MTISSGSERFSEQLIAFMLSNVRKDTYGEVSPTWSSTTAYGPTAQQGSGLDAAVADEQFLESSSVGVEGHVVEFAEFVASFAEGSLPDQVELPLDGGPFSVVRRRPEGTLIDDHDRIGPESAQLRPIDHLRLLAPPNDHGGDPPLLGIYQQMAYSAHLICAGSAQDLTAGGTLERLAHDNPNRARNSSTEAPRPTRSSWTNSSVIFGTTSASPETESCSGNGM